MERVIIGNTDSKKTKIEFTLKRKNKFMDQKVYSVFERDKEQESNVDIDQKRLFEEGNRENINGSSGKRIEANWAKANTSALG